MKELVPVLAALVTATGAISASIINKSPSSTMFAVTVLALVFAVSWLLAARHIRGRCREQQEVGHVKDVQDHPFFGEMMYYLEHVIPKLDVKDRYKCFVTKTFLRVKFETFAAGLKQAVADCSFRAEDHVRLLYELEKKSVAEVLREGVPKMFVDRFDENFTPIVEMMKDSIASIATSSFLPGQRTKHVAILYQYLAAFHNTIVAVENSINEMNGELEKVLVHHFSRDEIVRRCMEEMDRGK